MNPEELEMQPPADSALSEAQMPQPETSADDLPPELAQHFAVAIETVYGEGFEQVVEMFSRPGGFAIAMSTVVLGVLQKLEQEVGEPLDAETAAQVGGRVMLMLMEDLTTGGVLQGVGQEEIVTAVQMIMAKWVRDHRDQLDPEEAAEALRELHGVLAEEGLLEEEAPTAQEPPQGAPSPPAASMLDTAMGGMRQ